MSKVKTVKLPKVGRFGIVHEKSGFGAAKGMQDFNTNLSVTVLRDGKPLQAKDVISRWGRFWGNIGSQDTLIDLGSGLTTNVGSLAIANEFGWANPSGAVNTMLALAKYHVSGTGVTAAAATDIKLQTPSGFGGQTPVAGTQVLVSAANLQKYQTVATISYTGTEAVTEWGLITGTPLTATTGSPFTATTATSATVTGTPLTASSTTVAGQQLTVFEAGTTPSWGLVLSNTTSVVTIPAWYKTADGTAGTTPGATETYTIRPVLWDHKVFTAINVLSGDSIAYTYTLTVASGG